MAISKRNLEKNNSKISSVKKPKRRTEVISTEVREIMCWFMLVAFYKLRVFQKFGMGSQSTEWAERPEMEQVDQQPDVNLNCPQLYMHTPLLGSKLSL